MDRRDRILLNKMLDEAKVITGFIEGYDCALFLDDEKTKRAVCMALINIGEMVKALSDEVKSNNSEIPWRLIMGLRNVEAHGYQTLSMEDIWETVSVDILALQGQIKEIIQK